MNEKNYSSELYQELLLNEGLFDKLKGSLGIKGKKLTGDNLNKLETNITQLLANIAKELGAADSTDLINRLEEYKTNGIITDDISKYITDLNNLLNSIKTNKAKYGADTSGTAGTAGQTGTSGETGTAGTQGTAGQTGTSGTQGTSGQTGTSGETGTSGQTGTTGTTGKDQDDADKNKPPVAGGDYNDINISDLKVGDNLGGGIKVGQIDPSTLSGIQTDLKNIYNQLPQEARFKLNNIPVKLPKTIQVAKPPGFAPTIPLSEELTYFDDPSKTKEFIDTFDSVLKKYNGKFGDARIGWQDLQKLIATLSANGLFNDPLFGKLFTAYITLKAGISLNSLSASPDQDGGTSGTGGQGGGTSGTGGQGGGTSGTGGTGGQGGGTSGTAGTATEDQLTELDLNKFVGYYSQLIRLQTELKKELGADLKINKDVNRYFSMLKTSLTPLPLFDHITTKDTPLVKKLKKKFVIRFLWELKNTPAIAQAKDLIGNINKLEEQDASPGSGKTDTSMLAKYGTQSTSIIDGIKKSLPTMIQLLKALSKSKISNPEDKMLLSVLKTFLKSVVNKNTTDIKPDPKIANSVKTLTSLKPVSESSNYFKTSDYKYFF